MQTVRSFALSPSLCSTRPAGRSFTPVLAAKSRKEITQKRHKRLRHKLEGTPERPRLSVYRSNEHIYAQVIDDSQSHTLAAANSLQPGMREALNNNGATKVAAKAVGKKIAELCLAKNITKVAFDRGGFLYHGRIQAVADAARAGGLDF